MNSLVNLVIVIFVVAMYSIVIMLLWNYIVIYVLRVDEIDFWQAMVLTLMYDLIAINVYKLNQKSK
jgi:hypothetical protein